MAKAEPRALSAKALSSVAGGQPIRSALPVTAPAPAMIFSSSPAERESPFIFQLPATSGRRCDAAIFNPSCTPFSRNRARKAAPEAKAHGHSGPASGRRLTYVIREPKLTHMEKTQ